MVQILPSILSADFANLAHDVARVEPVCQMLHVDVMDGHFVPNITIGAPVVEALRKATKLKLDCHLMIADPDTYAPLFIEAGADLVSVHYEATVHLDRTLNHIKSHGVKAGVVLNPGTPVEVLEDVLDVVDYVLIMSVNPGFGGQQFIPNALRKIRRLDAMRRERKLGFTIEIDGGVSAHNTAEIVQAGCSWLVAGSAVFHSADPAAAVKEMQHIGASVGLVKV
jgi:ribulose-phosphate 3-epimerase